MVRLTSHVHGRPFRNPDSMKILGEMFSDTTLNSVEPESAAVTNKQIEEFNKQNGTAVKPGLTAVPFMK